MTQEGAYTTTPVAGTAPLFIVIRDSTIAQIWNLVVITTGQLNVVSTTFQAAPLQLDILDSRGTNWGLIVSNGRIDTFIPSFTPITNPIGYAGRGTQLKYSLDGITYSTIDQLQQFEPTGSKQAMVDQTNLSSPDSFTYPYPAQIDAGEIDFSGALNPKNLSYLVLGQLHGQKTLAFFQAILIDGSAFSFQAYVSEFKPFSVKWNKAYGWSGKLRIVGGMTSPFSAFQPNAFDNAAFEVVVI